MPQNTKPTNLSGGWVRATSDGTAGTITVGGDGEPTTTSEQEREQWEIELPSWTAAEFGYDGSHWLWIMSCLLGRLRKGWYSCQYWTTRS